MKLFILLEQDKQISCSFTLLSCTGWKYEVCSWCTTATWNILFITKKAF